LHLELKVRAKPDVQIAVPEQDLGPFEVLDRRARVEESGGHKQYIFALDLIAFEPGEHTLPALTVRAVGPSGALADLRTAPQTVTVGSLIANEPNAAPKAALEPVPVMEEDYTLLWIFGGLLAAALVAAATLLISRWAKRRPKPLPPAPPPKPPWELAMEKLQRLQRERDGLLRDGRGEEYVDGVSDALREYLGRRYGFDGLERTTDELLGILERLRPVKLSLSGVSLLLEQCDLVKFARMAPDAEMCEDLWNGAQGLVRATTPAPPDVRETP
jgi:hypothetical protein